MKAKQKCPNCDKGQMVVTLTMDNKSEQVQMDCVDCDGTGLITQSRLDALNHMKNSWCNCDMTGDESNVTYVDDNTKGALVKKHHWIHNKCKKIVQIG